MTDRRVLFACDLDSQVFGAAPLALAFQARGWRVTFAIHATSELSSAARNKIEGRFEILEARLGGLAVSEEAFGFDAIGVFATGSRISRFRHDLALASRVYGGRRPALFCGFNGLVFEKFEEGLAWRFGYDVVCLNSPRDRDAFLDFVGGAPFAAQPTAVVGLSRSGGVPVAAHAPVSGARKTFVFAEQVLAPSDRRHRKTLVATLARLAKASPGWRVVIKARVKPDERTFHQQVSHIATLVAALPRRPANLVLSYEPLDGLLAQADLFGTVSSTALFDALDHHVQCCVITDFGVRNAYGTHALFGSGLGVVLSECASLDDVPRQDPDPAWLDRVGYGPGHSATNLIDRLESFDHHGPFRPQAQSAPGMKTSARPPRQGVASGAAAIAAGRDEIEKALAGHEPETARAALGRLGESLTRFDVQHGPAAPSPPSPPESALAAFVRRRKIYWFYRRLRRAFRRGAAAMISSDLPQR